MKQKIILIDANSFLYRSYYAPSPFSKYRYKRSIAATYGFTKMLLRLLDKEKPDYIAVAFDLPAPAQRKKSFIQYLAKRPKMPPELKNQVPYIKDIIRSMDIALFEMDGFDADDILATIAKKAPVEDPDILIVTSFKDALQLTARPFIRVLNPHQKNLVYDAALVKERFGVAPEKFADFLALVGDDSENIPGVPGIGAKTAAGLLNKYKDIPGIMKNLDKINPKIARVIEKNKDDLLFGAKVATIDTTIPVEVDSTSLKAGKCEREKLAGIFKHLGFTDLLMPLVAPRHGQEDVYKTVLDKELFGQVLRMLEDSKEFCFDTETDSVDPLQARLVGISFCFEKGKAFYIPLAHSYEAAPSQLEMDFVLDSLRAYFLDSSKLKIGQNLKYDIDVLSSHGIDATGPFFDTMVASFMLEPAIGGHDLDTLSLKYFDRRMTSFSELVGQKASIAQVPVEAASEYACEDADMAFQLKKIFTDQLREKGIYDIFTDIEMKLLPILKDIEMAGIGVDTAHLAKLASRYETLLKDLKKRKLKARIKKSRKILSSFIRPFCRHSKDGRIRPLYSQIFSLFGGITSSRPNLHNIPREVFDRAEFKKIFSAPPGRRFLTVDFPQIEEMMPIKLAIVKIDKALKDSQAGARIALIADRRVVLEAPSRAIDKTGQAVKKCLEGIAGSGIAAMEEIK